MFSLGCLLLGVMLDCPPQNEAEAAARRSLVAIAQLMLRGEVRYLEGAVEVLRLKKDVGGIADFVSMVPLRASRASLARCNERHASSAP